MPEKNWNEVIQMLIDEIKSEDNLSIEGAQSISLDEDQLLEIAKYVGVVPKNTEVINKYLSNKKFVVVYKHKLLKRT